MHTTSSHIRVVQFPAKKKKDGKIFQLLRSLEDLFPIHCISLRYFYGTTPPQKLNKNMSSIINIHFQPTYR